jgi:hypothetical protein
MDSLICEEYQIDIMLVQVYRMFSLLALVARFCGGISNGVSVADDLLIVVRKQVSHSS